MRTLIAVPLAALALTACGKADDSTAAPPPSSATTAPSVTETPTTATAKTAQQYATALKARLSRVRRVIVITENNDPNNLLGRPNGYTSAAVLVDPLGERCQGDTMGVDCGAKVEVWSNAADAAARVTYVQKQLKDMPMLGTEYDYQAGAALLRVAGAVKPSIAKNYQRAWRQITG